MIVIDAKSQDRLSRKETSETILTARPVSRGIAVGRAVRLHSRRKQFYRIDLEVSEIASELQRFHSAVRFAKHQLKNIDAQKVEVEGKSKPGIFDAHLLMLEDKSLLSKVEEIITTEKINAEWAIKLVSDDFLAVYKTVADGHLNERYIDFEDVSERLQTALSGRESIFQLEPNSIIVAAEVKPSTLIELSGCRPQAIITERGGWTSHVFILARELNLPAVTGLKGILRHVQTGDEIVVDGYNGKVILHPTGETSRKYASEVANFQAVSSEKIAAADSRLKTLDGIEVTIRANVDLPSGYAPAEQESGNGIGLYRSEFLFNQARGFPTEDEQIDAYRKAAELAGAGGVRIRTFDLTAEQTTEETGEKEQNPALGLRGIRLGLSQEKQFRVQLRALLRASAENKIDIVLPLISDVSEIHQTKSILEKEKLNLKKQKIKSGNPQIGVMIEVPATIFIIEEIAAAVDFLCLGTNDLVQYLLAVDRDNESVAEWFRSLHPAVLRSIKKVIDAAEASRTPLAVCGEMAGSPVYAAILIGLGATELSMNPNSIRRVRKTIAAIAFEEAREITKQLLKCQTADDAERLASELFLKKWSHLFSPDILPASKK